MHKLGLKEAEETDQIAKTCWIMEKALVCRKTATSDSLITLKSLTVWITKKQRKILKEMGMSDHLFYFLRNLNALQEATFGTGHGTID